MTRTALIIAGALSLGDIAALYWLPAAVGFTCSAALALFWCRALEPPAR